MDRETETERERDCSEWTERLRQRERERERDCSEWTERLRQRVPQGLQ